MSSFHERYPAKSTLLSENTRINEGAHFRPGARGCPSQADWRQPAARGILNGIQQYNSDRSIRRKIDRPKMPNSPRCGRLTGSLVAALLVVHGSLLAWEGWRQSPAVDEVAHLPAGLSHWKLNRFDLYRV